MRVCNAEGCERRHYCKGWCRTHYERVQRHGSPDVNKHWKGGIRKHPLYGAWNQMINRCHNPNNSSYGRYGAKGIYVCDEWRSDFRNFLRDMGERPEGMTLDRIDPYGPYRPENCRWSTSREQRLNITKEGDERTRKATSRAKRAYWQRWREARKSGVSVPE